MRRPNVVRRTEAGRFAALVGLLLAGVLLAGCSDDEDPYADTGRSTRTDTRDLAQKVLNQRARAVRNDNLRLFLRHVDRSDRSFVARQKRYFRNVTQLPFELFGYRVRAASWPALEPVPEWGEEVRIPQVVHTTQLSGYDALPVRRTVGFVFSFERGRATLVSDTTPTGDPLMMGEPSPWDLTAITVGEAPGVLGIFDRETRDTADLVTGVIRAGMDALDRALPFGWEERVVVYDVADREVLDSFRDVPGGVITQLGAMTFPVHASDQNRKLASTRMLLLPSSVEAGEPFLGRITRHELSHVAIGTRDDGAPVWVSEGIAEYLGARELPQSERIIPTAAVSRAQVFRGRMPASRNFNGSDQEWHYAISWMACEFIAETQGEDTLWRLMDAMHADGAGTRDRRQDTVLLSVIGMDSRELAHRAAERIRTTYG